MTGRLRVRRRWSAAHTAPTAERPTARAARSAATVTGPAPSTSTSAPAQQQERTFAGTAPVPGAAGAAGASCRPAFGDRARCMHRWWLHARRHRGSTPDPSGSGHRRPEPPQFVVLQDVAHDRDDVGQRPPGPCTPSSRRSCDRHQRDGSLRADTGTAGTAHPTLPGPRHGRCRPSRGR